MRFTAGIDVGSTYTKAVVMKDGSEIAARAMRPTGFQLEAVAFRVYEEVLAAARLSQPDIAYVVSTGYGRDMVSFRDAKVTDLTAHARGAAFLFPGTRTVLDVGGQTMKASRLDERAKVRSFRLNDKCAAGTGAFLEKTALYLGFGTGEIGPLAATSKTPVPISGVCAVFAESEVINHVTSGASPADIMQGAIISLVGRSVQLMRRIQMEPEFTLVGGILRFGSMAAAIRKELGDRVNVPAGDMPQFNGALGAAALGHRRLLALGAEGGAVGRGTGQGCGG